MLRKEVIDRIGRYGIQLAVNENTDPLNTFSEAEGSRQVYLIADAVLGNKLLQPLYDETRALDMAG